MVCHILYLVAEEREKEYLSTPPMPRGHYIVYKSDYATLFI